MKRIILLSVTAIALIVAVGSTRRSVSAATFQTRTQTTGVITVAHANGNCTLDECSSSNHCASCQTLTVYLPLTAQVQNIRCRTNAGGEGGDSSAVRDTPCSGLDAWATFDGAVQSSTPQNTVVQTTFHNRSHNRDRLVELAVDYTL